jgi:regulator of sirC expression with transglutaminase-like and TPR domain
VLTRLLAGRHGYHGDELTYDDYANANLIRVIERRQGMPVALGVIWLHACRAVGWDAHGVDFPGHFLIALAAKGSQVVLDVFNGGIEMKAPELRALIKRIEGETAELRPGVLQPMNARGVLLRLQNNIKGRRLEQENISGGLACVVDMLRIAPDHATLWREAAMLHQALDQVTAAVRCYEQFLILVPEGEAASRTRATIAALRGRLN